MNYIIARKGQKFLADTRRGWEIILDSKKIRMTEGWTGLNKEPTGRRVILSGNKDLLEEVGRILSRCLVKDKDWNNVFIYWFGLRGLKDFLLLFLLKCVKKELRIRRV